MKKLIIKELRLSMHPVTPFMLLLSAMVFISNYPFTVISFYNAMAIFFTCLQGRENRDILYSLALPVAKREIVRARILFAALIELTQLALMLPCLALAQKLNPNGNLAGWNANLALVGLELAVYGVFNFVFFVCYYKNVDKVGASFVKACCALCLCLVWEIASSYAVPFVRDVLATPDPVNLGAKLAVVGIGAAVYAVLTLAACKLGERRFVAQDIH